MTPYTFCLLLGSSGLLLMAALGHLHHGGTDAAGRGIDHQLGDAPNAHHADWLGAGKPHLGAGVFGALLSPRALLTMLVGAGAGGLVGSRFLPEPGPLLSALGSALLFELGVVGPLSRLLLQFGSRPARTLESAICDEAVASTRFDPRGQGLVSLELDGHHVHLLATLTDEQRALGVRIDVGDRLLVEAVDPELHRCTVSRR